MKHTLYNRLIKPPTKDSDQAEREIVLNYLLVGIFVLSVIAFIITLFGPVIANKPAFSSRLLGNFITIAFIVGLYSVARYKRQYRPVAIILTLLIALFGCFVAFQWGMLDPDSVLLLSLSVVMAGILIGARYSLYVTCCLAVLLAYLQHGESTGRLHPDLTWLGTKPVPGDAVSFAAILFIIAFVSWLFNRQMELSLKRARRSEKALQRQKALLEVKVQKRTKELDAARLEQMRELYRFAELGRLSTALFHDLANHLATVSVDIEGLKRKDQSDIMQRIHGNVRHIDSVVRRVRQQIQGKNSVEAFNVMDEINEVVDMLSFDAAKAGVSMILEPSKIKPSLFYKGDLTRFRQILLNVISNGIEAYDGRRRSRKDQLVTIRLERVKTDLMIHITDHGAVIPHASLKKIFEPFYTTKPKGVGIGLFIVKQVVENDFKGSIDVRSDKRQGTTFSVVLPKSYYVKSPRN